VLLLPAIATAAATGAAVALVAQPARTAVGLCGAVATLLVLATACEAVRRGRLLRSARAEHVRRTAYLEQRVAGHEEENRRLAKEHLPAAIDRMHQGHSPREVLRQLSLENPHFRALSKTQLEVIKSALRLIEFEEALRDSSQRSFVSVARRVQAIVHQQAKELREMEEDHGRNPEVFDDLLRIDHGTAMIGRLADSVAVLGGGRPGRQWPLPVPLYSVLRGAMSRILEYPRISLDNIAKVNIRGISVEPVIHACAELLDNATRYSPPTTKVHVTATEVQTGIAIEIEDSGVSLTEEARLRLEELIEQAKRAEDLQAISEAPRLGLAVVGRLCTTYKMQISLRPSAYGGTKAVLVVPREMVTSDPAPGYAHGIGATSLPIADTDGVEGPKRPPKRRRPTNPRIPADLSLDDEVPIVTEWTDKGLPQRRRKIQTSLSERIAEQLREEAEAKREGRPTIWEEHEARQREEARARGEEVQKDDRPPGLWVESFWEGLRKGLPEGADPTEFTRHPEKFTYLIDDKARPGADDEGDLT
jgi:signal transduction histidine kinase